MTLSRAVCLPSRLNCWKTKPTLRLRMSASSFSVRLLVYSPSIFMYPLVGVSRHPMRFIIVLLPEPEGPMIAVNEPLRICAETPSSALTQKSPTI